MGKEEWPEATELPRSYNREFDDDLGTLPGSRSIDHNMTTGVEIRSNAILFGDDGYSQASEMVYNIGKRTKGTRGGAMVSMG